MLERLAVWSSKINRRKKKLECLDLTSNLKFLCDYFKVDFETKY